MSAGSRRKPSIVQQYPATNRYQPSAPKIGKSTTHVCDKRIFFFLYARTRRNQTTQRKYTLLHKRVYIHNLFFLLEAITAVEKLRKSCSRLYAIKVTN